MLGLIVERGEGAGAAVVFGLAVGLLLGLMLGLIIGRWR